MLTVWSTRVGITGIFVDDHRVDWWDESAGRQGITLVARVACADRVVVPDVALGVDATRPGTRVPALLLHTGQVVRALSVDEALWPTAHVRVSDVLWYTLTGAGTIPGRAAGIGAAR